MLPKTKKTAEEENREERTVLVAVLTLDAAQESDARSQQAMTPKRNRKESMNAVVELAGKFPIFSDKLFVLFFIIIISVRHVFSGREVSRGGRGAFGFGNVSQEAQEAEKDPASTEFKEDMAIPDWSEEPAADAEPVEEAAPEPPTFTLDEYLRQRDDARLNFLKANGVASTTKTVEMSSEAVAAEKARKDQRSTVKNQISDVAFKFEQRAPESRDRGQRSGPRSGPRDGPREGYRGKPREGGYNNSSSRRNENGNAKSSDNAIFSTIDFPSL
jgi:hypothetical protein